MGNSRWERVLNLHPAAMAGILLAGVFVVVIGLQLWQNTRVPPGPAPVSDVKLSNPGLEAKAMGIASKFSCSCGSCSGKGVDTCECQQAAEERKFIRESIQEGKSVDDVIAAVDRNYGGKRSGSNMNPEGSGLGDGKAGQ